MTGPVRLALDLQALQVAGYADRGVGRYVAALATALAARDRVAAGLLAPELPPPDGLPPALAAAGLVRFDCRAEARALAREAAPLARLVPAPFLHCAPDDPTGLVVAPHWEELGLPRVVLLHDLIPLRAPHHYLPTPAHVDRYRARLAWVAGADLVVTNSEHTRTEAVDVGGCRPEGVVTVGAGVAPYFTPPDGSDAELFRWHFPHLEDRPFLFTVGGSDTRKNTERLVLALGALVGAGHDLHLLVGGGLSDPWRSRLHDAARHAGVAGRVVLGGTLEDELLRACYRRAAATVVPSLAEGFGLPVLESAACGTPALASATSALVEAAATPLATFDPTDTAAVAASVAALLEDPERRARVLAAQGALAAASTWEAVAGRTVEALDAAVAGPGPRAATAHRGRAAPLPGPRRRVALVGPLPPVPSGIAVYDERLLGALPDGAAVDAVTPRPSPPPGALPPGVARFDMDAFGLDVRPASYDAVVYALGNSDGHLATVECALRFPGWVWLHEVRLPAIAVTALDGLDDDGFAGAMAWLLERAYPGRPPLAAARRAGRSVLELVAGGVGLVPLLAERCRGFLVNSEVAARLLALDLAPLAQHPPVHVLPPACPPARSSARPDPEGEPVVVALGVVSMAKRPDLVVDAAARAGCRLAFVGPCDAFLAQVIGDRARLRGTADRVEVTGAVDDAAWAGWLERAAVAVQLRQGTSGETSAAVLEALAAGVPVLTNLATATGYPPGTVAGVQSTDPDAVAPALTRLLGCDEERRALSAAGVRFAADHGFAQLAGALLAAVAP
ncbi:MAG TPA: glycosyltransferase [Acidimicrobiales bacterium]|nr:glycosyltransferase [Acidimicrobiales bacterium]